VQRSLLQDKYPIYSLQIPKAKCRFDSIEGILGHLKACVEAHPFAVFISTFDHYSHTKSLADGEMAPDIKDARNFIFCFGHKLPSPQMLAMRPRAIGVAETQDAYHLSFLEAPMAFANEAMESWVKGVQGEA
jgi:hypothetical protein